MKKYKLLSLILALAMVMGMLAGCGSTAASEASAAEETAAESAVAEEAEAEEPEEAEAEEPEEAPAEADEAPEAASAEEAGSAVEEEAEAATVEAIPVELPIVDEPITYSIWYSEPFTEYVDNPMEDVSIFGLLADKTGISFDFTLVTVDSASEQFQLLFAADSLPDVITDAMDYYNGSIDDAVFEDEFLYDYSGDLETIMTNYNAVLHQKRFIEARKRVTSAQTGAMVSFPELYKDVGDEDGYMIRKDFMDEAGITEVPTTYDEMHDVLTAIHDVNGAALDLSSSGGDGQLGAGFGINCGLDDDDLGGWYVVDDEVRMGILQPEFKDYLEMVKQWYSEGIIYADFINTDNGDLSNLFSGAVSITTKVPEIIEVASSVVGATMVPMTAPVQNEGDVIQVCGGESSCVMDANTWSININTEEIEPLLKLIDYMYSDEANDMMNYGEEGVTFTYDADGNPEYTDMILNNPDGYDFAHAGYFYATSNRTRLPFVADYARCFATYSEAAMEAVDIYTNDCTHELDYPNGAILDTDQTTEYNTVAADIATYISENVLKFIYGEKEMDEWDSFVETLYSMGVETAISAKQAAYDDYLAS